MSEFGDVDCVECRAAARSESCANLQRRTRRLSRKGATPFSVPQRGCSPLNVHVCHQSINQSINQSISQSVVCFKRKIAMCNNHSTAKQNVEYSGVAKPRLNAKVLASKTKIKSVCKLSVETSRDCVSNSENSKPFF